MSINQEDYDEDQVNEDLRELKAWFGSWDELRAKINDLEEGDFEQSFEDRATDW
jgi:hypothetical protein